MKILTKSFQGLGILCGVLEFLPYFATSCSCRIKPVADTKLGKIIGTTIDVDGTLVNQYLGIPYAKPPIGYFRFKKPRKIKAWKKPIEATREPRACIQYTQGPFPWYDNKPGKSEDCLYLNIWAPSDANSTNRKAVFYWIYGGGFHLGSFRGDIYTGHVISALGDVVVITVNYRLGSLGFLFSNTKDAPGNVALWDILTSLQWVNDNIEAFGGDVNRITIAGQSAGAITIGMLSSSPLAHGLYRRQIMESGSSAHLGSDNVTQNQDISQRVAEIVGCANKTYSILLKPKEVVRCLRGINAMALVKAEASIFPHASGSYSPRFGDELLPKNPRESIREGDFQDNEILIGINLDEGGFEITTKHLNIFGFFGEKDPQINKTCGKYLIQDFFAKFPNREGVVKHYLPDNVTEDQYELIRRQVYTAAGDKKLLCPAVYFAEKYAEKGNNVYFYLWHHRPSSTPWAPWMGVPHFSEVQFVFGNPVKNPGKYESGEILLSLELIEYWTNFTKYGKPSDSWPLYSKDDPQYKYLSIEPKEKGTGPNRNNCDFFRPYFGF